MIYMNLLSPPFDRFHTESFAAENRAEADSDLTAGVPLVSREDSRSDRISCLREEGQKRKEQPNALSHVRS